MISLSDRLAVITGAARGIGAAIAAVLHKAGARVVLGDVDEAMARATAAQIAPEGGRAFGYRLDVADRATAQPFADLVRTEHGPVSFLVNNAAISRDTLIDDPDLLEAWDRQLAVNLTGVLLMSQVFAQDLKATRGAIVNIASLASFHAVSKSVGYVASKGGVKLLTQSLARSFASDGVRVNAVAPGIIRTDLTRMRMADPEWMQVNGGRILMARPGEPEDVADPVVFLCSEMARYITGAILPVDGGFLAV